MFLTNYNMQTQLMTRQKRCRKPRSKWLNILMYGRYGLGDVTCAGLYQGNEVIRLVVVVVERE